jgi:hypothetical protein
MDRDMEVHRLTAGCALCVASAWTCASDAWSARTTRARVRRAARPHGQRRSSAAARLALARRRAVLRATHANPMGLTSRRRYRWTRGRISDYWDEVFTPDGLDGHARARRPVRLHRQPGQQPVARMRDVLGTIQADQDAIIRAGSRGALVVDGGPGTGRPSSRCTARRTSSTPTRASATAGRRAVRRPHQPYLAYVADVLPSLGEEGVQTCTLRTSSPEGAARRSRPTRRGPPEVVRGLVQRSSRPSGSTRSRPPRG